MVGTLPIIFSAKTLDFRTILIALPVENPESLITFFIEGKSAVSKCLSRKDLAPRGGFEPPTFRLTAKGLETLNALSCVAYRETRPIFSPSVGLLGLPNGFQVERRQVGASI